MATTRTANAHWEGNLFEGSGQVTLASSGVGEFAVSWPARAEAPNGVTSPEELIAAAHSACFNMGLAHALAQAGTVATALDTTAAVTFVPGTGITTSHLTVRGVVAGITQEQFSAAAEGAKANCPVSMALTGVDISVEALLAE